MAVKIQRSDALGSVEFVGGKRKRLDRKLAHVHRDFPNRLNGIGVKVGISLRSEGGGFGDGTENTGLVVGPDERS